MRTIAFLEDGEFDSLPAEVFARGFLRSYAEAVGLDPTDTLKAYDACRPASPAPQRGSSARGLSGSDDRPSTVAVGSEQAHRRRRSARRAGSLLALVALALTVARCVANGT